MPAAIKYFLYSREQVEFRKKIEAKMGRIYSPGYVIAGGAKKLYSEISAKPFSSRYSDANVVAYGNINEMVYVQPTVIKRGSKQ